METKAKIKVKIKKGDIVMAIAGNFKGKSGRVLSVDYDKLKVLVEGINIIKKHTKPNAKNQQGGIIKKEAPVDISNVMVIDPKTHEPSRIGRRPNDKGKLVRYSKKSGEEI